MPSCRHSIINCQLLSLLRKLHQDIEFRKDIRKIVKLVMLMNFYGVSGINSYLISILLTSICVDNIDESPISLRLVFPVSTSYFVKLSEVVSGTASLIMH